VTASRTAVLRPGDLVRYDAADHQVVALAGTSVRLRCDAGETVVLASYLMACPDFTVLDGTPLPTVEPIGLLDGLPAKVVEDARAWERCIVEVETGLPRHAASGTEPRPGFDPATTTVADRDKAMAAELGVSLRTMQIRRARYARQGLWGLVDQRRVKMSEATGRVDARLVAVIRDVVDAETDTSTGTRSRLIHRVMKVVEATYGRVWCRCLAGRRSTR
jgi:putative transposase